MYKMNQHLAILLKQLRKERGISQLQLADEAGVKASVVNRAERGGEALVSPWVKLFRGLGHHLTFDTEELAEEYADLLAEEAARRRERRLMGLIKSGRILRWPY